MWDVSLVVDYISQLGENKDLSLKDLSSKLLTLMALTTASCVSELQALDLRFHYYKPHGVLFKLATLTKKRQLGASPKELFFSSFPEDNNLCMVQCLKHYESRTESFRVILPDQASPLFLSTPQTSDSTAVGTLDKGPFEGIRQCVQGPLSERGVYFGSYGQGSISY